MTDIVGVITPEAVLLELPPAGIATRMFAKFVDLVCQLALLIAGGYTAGSIAVSEGGSSPIARIFMIVWTFFVLLVVPGVVEGLWNGKTPGKAMLGLRVVSLDGGPSLWRHAFVRDIAQIIDIYIPLGIIPALSTSRSRRFGDLMAGTFVLVERGSSRPSVPIAFYPPPGCEQFIASLDVGRLRTEQYRLLRSFLLRVAELDGQARWHLAVRFADAVRDRVTPAPPPNMPPELFLVCVASAYQYRNGGLPGAAPQSMMPAGPPQYA